VNRKCFLILSGMIIFVIISFVFLIYYNKQKVVLNSVNNCIPTAQVAKDMAGILCKNMYPEVDAERYDVSVTYEERKKSWIVIYSLINDSPNTAVILGGGGPVFHINKQTAEVTVAYLQK